MAAARPLEDSADAVNPRMESPLMNRLIEQARSLRRDARAMTSLEYGLLAAMVSAIFMFGLPPLLSAMGLMS
jgi:Flp pilus assembly pilin Flp